MQNPVSATASRTIGILEKSRPVFTQERSAASGWHVDAHALRRRPPNDSSRMRSAARSRGKGGAPAARDRFLAFKTTTRYDCIAVDCGGALNMRALTPMQLTGRMRRDSVRSAASSAVIDALHPSAPDQPAVLTSTSENEPHAGFTETTEPRNAHAERASTFQAVIHSIVR